MKFCRHLFSVVLVLQQILLSNPNAGIQNKNGNDCFMNSSMQLLSHIRPIIDFANKNQEFKKQEPQSVFFGFIDNLKKSKIPLAGEEKTSGSKAFRNFWVKLPDIIDKTGKKEENLMKHLEKGQQDAEEFLGLLLNKINSTNEKVLDCLIFNLEQQNICKNCNQEGVSKSIHERFLSLPVSGHDSLAKCLQSYLTENELKDYECDTCFSKTKAKTTAKQLFKISSLPDYFIFTFKRAGFNTKHADAVKFDFTINLNDVGDVLPNYLQPYATYRLKAFIVHGGRTVNSGHYWAYGNDGKDWYLYNDADVSLANNDVKTILETGQDSKMIAWANPVPYILLYEKYDAFAASDLKPEEPKPTPGPKKDQLAIKLEELKNAIKGISIALYTGILSKLRKLTEALKKKTALPI